MIEAGSTITARGNSSLCVVAGSIFNFAFGNRSKNKNIVVIPVNTGFDVHVSRKYEGKTKQVVSIETLHGMWLDEMMRRSASKEFCDNTYTKVSEDSLKRRIEEDLRARGYEKGSNEEYPLGSIAVIEEGNTIFYLLAASKFDENNNAHATKEDIEKLLISLVNFYDCNGQGLDMYLPLIGTGMSRTGLCNQESFNKICKAFSPDANLYIGKVTIVVMPNVYEELELER